MENFRKRGKEAVLICVCMMVIAIMPATAPSMPTISVEPSHLKVLQNETFTINITVNPAGYEIYAAQYDLYFNPIILKTISQSQGNFLSQDGANTIVLVNEINNTIGKIEYGETRMGVENGVATPGTLASITFKAIKCGRSELKLSNVILSDTNAMSIMTNVSSGDVIVEPIIPFLISGSVIYSSGMPVLHPKITITNLNTSEELIAKTSESYYQVLTDSAHVCAGNILHFHINTTTVVEFNYTVTEDDMRRGGFEKDIVFGAMFDTGRGEYPSIAGIHNGTITPEHDIIVNCIYTYPCEGTGGHTERVIIYNDTGIIAEACWNGYIDDYHNITFPHTFILLANHTYNYTIITGSYPQIRHTNILETDDGVITCSKFIDANGRRYTDWIPAIRLYYRISPTTTSNRTENIEVQDA